MCSCSCVAFQQERSFCRWRRGRLVYSGATRAPAAATTSAAPAPACHKDNCSRSRSRRRRRNVSLSLHRSLKSRCHDNHSSNTISPADVRDQRCTDCSQNTWYAKRSYEELKYSLLRVPWVLPALMPGIFTSSAGSLGAWAVLIAGILRVLGVRTVRT